MKQSQKESWIEAGLNTLSGFVVSYFVWALIVAPLFDLPITHTVNFLITSIFTMTSLLRSYLWRRFFNAELNRWVHVWVMKRAFPMVANDARLKGAWDRMKGRNIGSPGAFDYHYPQPLDYRSHWTMRNSDGSVWGTSGKYTHAEVLSWKISTPVERTN